MLGDCRTRGAAAGVRVRRPRLHYVEPFDMPAEEQTAFWSEAMTIAAAVDRVVSPAKMNYEIHGNTVPHLHLHLFPRQRDDPYVGGPIDPRKATFTRTEDEIEALSRAIRQVAP